MELKDARSAARGRHRPHRRKEGFRDADVVFLVGAKPPEGSGARMLIRQRCHLRPAGEALGEVAPNARVLVVGNPANTSRYPHAHAKGIARTVLP